MLATLVVETGVSNATWVKRHRAEVETLLKQALANADARTLQASDGLATLQTELKQTVNAALPSPLVQQVLITDLVYQSEE
jgi:flagellar basal body-associated protein FliL